MFGGVRKFHEFRNTFDPNDGGIVLRKINVVNLRPENA